MIPRDPTGAVGENYPRLADLPTAVLIERAQMAVERLRDTIRLLAPEANITDSFEGAEAATVLLALRSRL